MKEKELREHTTCTLCKQPVGRTELPLFWTVTIERHGIKIDALQRQDAFAQMLNSRRLTEVMGLDAELTETLLGPITTTMCEVCVSTELVSIAYLAHLAHQESYEEISLE